MRRQQPAEPPAPIAWAGWYSVVGDFWAAWLDEPPSANPWRTPTFTGRGDFADAERRIRACKGAGALVRQMHESWARGAEREAFGKAPDYRPPPKPKAAHQSSRASAAEAAHWTWLREQLDRVAREAAQQREEKGRRRQAEEQRFADAFEAFFAEYAKFMGGAAPPPPGRVAFGALGLDPTAGPEEVQRAYRRLHPDHGGDPAAFRVLTAQRDAALAHAERSRATVH